VDDLINLIIPIVIAVVWIGGAIVKKIGQAAQKQAMAGRPGPGGDDEERESAFRTGQDEVRAFLEQMGAAPPSPPPPPKPVPMPAPQPKPSVARAAAAAAGALKAAAARRARRANPKAARAAAAAKPKRALKRKDRPEERERLEAYRTNKSGIAAAGFGEGPLERLTRLPLMQRAVVLKEILGPPTGMGPDPLKREA